MSRTEQPCGCIWVTDSSPVMINGKNLHPLVANVKDIEPCAEHKKMFADSIAEVQDQWIEYALFAYDREHP